MSKQYFKKQSLKSLTRRGNKVELAGGKREMAVKDGKKFWKVCHSMDANKVSQMRDDLIFFMKKNDFKQTSVGVGKKKEFFWPYAKQTRE